MAKKRCRLAQLTLQQVGIWSQWFFRRPFCLSPTPNVTEELSLELEANTFGPPDICFSVLRPWLPQSSHLSP